MPPPFETPAGAGSSGGGDLGPINSPAIVGGCVIFASRNGSAIRLCGKKLAQAKPLRFDQNHVPPAARPLLPRPK